MTTADTYLFALLLGAVFALGVMLGRAWERRKGNDRRNS
ncbi:MAG: hypothetical protein JWR07_1946 [Nevskia sp.]|nr:hypothetical protein [Nevskia sp.]